MKKILLNLTLILGLSSMMTSCYVYNMNIGKGSQTGVQVRQKNSYLIAGLVSVGQSDPKQMANNAADYSVTIKHSFIDYLLGAITFGIYTPTTTIVTK